MADYKIELDSSQGLPTGTNTLGSVGVFFSPSNPTVSAILSGSVAAYFSPSNPSVNVGTPTVAGINSSVGVYFDRANPSVTVSNASIPVTGTFWQATQPVSGTVTSNAGTGTTNVSFSPSNPSVNISNVSIPVTTAGVWNVGATASIASAGASVTGTTSTAGGAGLNTLVARETGKNIKVYAYSLSTTAIATSFYTAFSTGGSAGATKLWQVNFGSAITWKEANLSVTPPGYIFATGVGNTLALYLGTGSNVYYNVAYFKETA